MFIFSSTKEKIGGISRPPVSFKQWDKWACEASCSIQILYMHGLVDSVDHTGFDRRIGRVPDQPDLRYGCTRVLFESKFEMLTVSLDGVVSARRMLNSKSYVIETLIRDGMNPHDAAAYGDDTYRMLQRRLRHILTVLDQYQGRWREENRKAVPSDVVRLLDRGWVVICDLPTSWAGVSHQVLLVPTDAGPLLYNPDGGVIKRINPSKDLGSMLPSITGWRLAR